MSLSLTECQDIALSGLTNWSYSDRLFATLTGAAGTGKTTLLGVLLKQIKQKYGVVVTAPTHQAKRILAQKTNKDNYTIQALLGLQPLADLEVFDPNRPEFKPTGREQIQYAKIVVVDEASMLNDALFDYLCELAEKYGVKVLFVGDVFQLKPVKQKTIAKCFDPTVITDIFTLTEVVRQALNNPISIPLAALRNDLAYEQFGYIDSKESANFFKAVMTHYEGKIALNNPSKAFRWVIDNLPTIGDKEGYRITRDFGVFAQNLILNYRSDDYSEDPTYVKALAYKNTKVSEYNNQIRTFLYKDKTDTLIPGELITGYKSIFKDQEEVLVNSKVYSILEIKEEEYKGIQVWKTTMSSLDGDCTTTLRIVRPEDYAKFAEWQQYAYRTMKSGEYRDALSSFQNLHNLGDIYPKGLLMEFEDMEHYALPQFLPRKTLDYGYACTVHKSQGSTYGTVFVDGKDIISTARNDLDTIYRLLYVGLSRASDFATLYL